MMYKKTISVCLPLLSLIMSVCLTTFFAFSDSAHAAWSGEAASYGDKVDIRIWNEFKHSSIQRVIVGVEEGQKSATKYDANESRAQALSRQKIRIAQLKNIKQGILDDLSTKGGAATLIYELPSFALMVIEAGRSQIESLAADERVTRIWFNDRFKPLVESSVPYTGANAFHLEGFNGAGTAVAVIDGPVKYWNGEFGDCSEVGSETCSIKAWENFTNQDPTEIADGLGHGSNVAGIVLGMAPDTDILSLNVFRWFAEEHNFMAEGADILAALDWVATNAKAADTVAVNMSLGSERDSSKPCNDDPRFDALKTLWEANGIVTVIASGNEAQLTSLGSPACISLAVSVGAQYDDDLTSTMSYSCMDLVPATGKIACYSNLNGALDIVAPGINVTAGGYEDYSGTSMAAPHVAGAVALMQSFWQSQEGAQRSAFWADRSLQFMAVPLPGNGYIYKSLRFPEDLQAYSGYKYVGEIYFKESEEAAIPAGSEENLEIKLNVADGPDKAGGVYLHLDIIHPTPEEVSFTLTAPDGTSAAGTLPAGQANFNSVLGREYFPGIFASMHDVNPDGEWTLQLHAAINRTEMYYLSSALWLSGPECTADCTGRECGDDGCGGNCGECGDGMLCSSAGECYYRDEFCKGDTCRGAQQIEIPSATTFYGNTRECSDNYESKCASMFTQDKVYRLDVERDANFFVRVSGFKASLYLREDECEGEELFCEKPLEGSPATIETVLKPGTYFLFVDGSSFESGEFQLEVDVCAPDCSGRECGSDGCGGECGGECPEGRSCSDAGMCACEFAECGGVCCAENEVCAGETCCLPDCTARECGDDSCGGSCGDCTEGSSCGETGICTPDETGGDNESEAQEESEDEESGNGDGADNGSGSGGCNSNGAPATTLLLTILVTAAVLRRKRVL